MMQFTFRDVHAFLFSSGVQLNLVYCLCCVDATLNPARCKNNPYFRYYNQLLYSTLRPLLRKWNTRDRGIGRFSLYFELELFILKYSNHNYFWLLRTQSRYLLAVLNYASVHLIALPAYFKRLFLVRLSE